MTCQLQRSKDPTTNNLTHLASKASALEVGNTAIASAIAASVVVLQGMNGHEDACATSKPSTPEQFISTSCWLLSRLVIGVGQGTSCSQCHANRSPPATGRPETGTSVQRYRGASFLFCKYLSV